MPTRFSLAQVASMKANLEAIPSATKDIREVGLQGAIKALAPTIRKLASRGYSRQKIIALLNEQGIRVSPSSFKHYLAPKLSKRKVQTSAPATQRASIPTSTATASGSDHGPTASLQGASISSGELAARGPVNGPSKGTSQSSS